MNTVTISVDSRNAVTQRALAAFKGQKQGAFITFASVELLWETLTADRWKLLRAMTGQGVITIDEVAHRVGQDVKAVHNDVAKLIKAGVLDCIDENNNSLTENSHIIFPFDAVHVDFMLQAA